ncbi:MAG: hypothetical protein P8M26_05365 [Gammaproteobacteria bacterium]|nr:hypothetical protein [Gammaproteobacteria bacterium]
MNTQANRFGINTLAFAMIVFASLVATACESNSRPVHYTTIVAPAVDGSATEQSKAAQMLTHEFRAQADAAALATHNEVSFDLAMRIHSNDRKMVMQKTIAATAAESPYKSKGLL